jgi:hypothetical protein
VQVDASAVVSSQSVAGSAQVMPLFSEIVSAGQLDVHENAFSVAMDMLQLKMSVASHMDQYQYPWGG